MQARVETANEQLERVALAPLRSTSTAYYLFVAFLLDIAAHFLLSPVHLFFEIIVFLPDFAAHLLLVFTELIAMFNHLLTNARAVRLGISFNLTAQSDYLGAEIPDPLLAAAKELKSMRAPRRPIPSALELLLPGQYPFLAGLIIGIYDRQFSFIKDTDNSTLLVPLIQHLDRELGASHRGKGFSGPDTHTLVHQQF